MFLSFISSRELPGVADERREYDPDEGVDEPKRRIRKTTTMMRRAFE